MDFWEVVVTSYPKTCSIKSLTKAVNSAKVLLKEDLADFEIDFFLQTLFGEPVYLLRTLSEKRYEEGWSLVIGHSLELINSIVDNLSGYLGEYLDDLVKTCILPYPAVNRRRALQCMISVTKSSPSHVIASISDIICDGLVHGEDSMTVKAVRAELIGVICEYHPELMREKYLDIWRNYLNLLEASKTTDYLKNGILKGLSGLFKHFGEELPTSELNSFYNKMTQKYLNIEACEKSCIELICVHIKLYPELASKDERIRSIVWRHHNAEHLMMLYDCVINRDNVQCIISSEIIPKFNCKTAQERYAAYMLVSNAIDKYATLIGDIQHMFHRQATSLCTKLLFSLEQKIELQDTNEDKEWEFDYDLLQLVHESSWCITSNLPESELLLKCVILLYHRIPSNQRKKYVAHTILKTKGSLRKNTLLFLINTGIASNTYTPLWRQLFDTDNGTDVTVLDNCKPLFDDLMLYLMCVFKEFLAMDTSCIDENTISKLSSILSLLSQILTYDNTSDYIQPYLNTIFDSLLTVKKRGYVSNVDSLLLCLSVLLQVSDEGCAFENGGVCDAVLEELRAFLESLSPNTCRDESSLCATCILLMRAPSILIHDNKQVLEAIYVIFSRNDVESTILSRALIRFEDIILNSNNSHKTLLSKIIHRISNLRLNIVNNDKTTRVLQREVIIFLGKYGSVTHKNREDDVDNTLIINLKDKISLDLPYLNSGTHFKLSLEKILHLAIVGENAQALEKLLVIICACLSNKSDVQLQIALVTVIYRMCRCHCRGEHLSVQYLEHAVAMCSDVQCVLNIVQYITSDISPGVRKMMCDLLETLISKQELSKMDECIRNVHEQAELMMTNEHSISKRAGLDLAESLTCILKKNNTLAKEFTPKLLVSISRTNEKYSLETFRETMNLFLDKIVLFDNDVLLELFSKSIRNLLEINEYDLYKSMSKNTALVLKGISDYLCWDIEETFDKFWKETKHLRNNIENIPKLLFFYSVLKSTFDITKETQCNFISKDNFELFNMLKKLIENCKEANESIEFCSETIYFTFDKYSAALMEVKYQATLECFAEFLKYVTPTFIKTNHIIIEKCFRTYKCIWKTLPQILINSLEYWLKKYLRIKEIALKIDQKLFTYEDSITLNSTKKLLNIFDLEKMHAISTEINENSRKITGILLKLYATNYINEYLQSQMSYLTDLLAVCLYFLSENEVKSYMHEGIDLSGVSTEKLGLRFCAFFIEAWAPFLLSKEWFLTPELVKCSPLFHDVIKFYASQKCNKDICNNIFITMDKLWPHYTTKFNLVHLCGILQDVSPLALEPWSLASNPGQWWLQSMASDISIDDKLKLMQVLKLFVKKGVEQIFEDDYRKALTSFSNHLPSKVTELQSRVSPALLLVLLNSLSETLDREVLRVVCGIFVSDNTKGWWDSALENTIQMISKCSDLELAKHVYAICNKNDMYICLYERVLVPFLRYAPMNVCEQFYPLIMKDVLSNLNRKLRTDSTISATLSYFVLCTRGLILAQSVFEKLPLNLLESPSSILYADIKLKYSKTLASELCKVCVTLRGVQCGADATDDVKHMYRKFQTSIWNCLSAILYKINAGINVYKVILKEDVWERIVDKDIKYVIYIQAQGRSSTRRHSLPTYETTSQLSPLATFTSNPSMFLTMKFSDNPLQYDLLSANNQITEETPTYHLSLSDNALNSHPCMTSVCVQLTRVSSIENRQWLEWIQSSIEVNGGNVAWFLGQAIINCKEVLKPLRNELESSMIHIIANTTYEHEGVKLLNGLHIQIIETLAHWYNPARDSNLDPNVTNLNNTLHHLIHTYGHHKTREYIQKTILKCMGQFLVLYGKWVQVVWEDIEKDLKEPQTAPHMLTLLTLLSKHDVFIPQLLTSLPKWLSVSNRSVKLTDIAKLYAMTVKCCHEETVKNESLGKFWTAVDRIRAANPQEYIKVLFYAQNECQECCNEMQFRHTTNLTNQMIREQKSKCYSILSNFIQRCNEINEYISHMLENVDLFDAVVNAEHTAIALNLAKNGLNFMSDDMKRRVVFLTSEYCNSPVHKIKMQAVQLMVKAFKEMLSTSSCASTSKRRRLDYPSKVMSMLHTSDIYSRTVFTSVCVSVCDMDSLLGEVKGALSMDLDVRLAECLLLTLHRPNTAESDPNTSEHSRTVTSARCLSRCLELYFDELVTNDGFKNMLLRDMPLEQLSSSETGISKLLTLSKSYQGTFRSQYTTGTGTKRNVTADQSTKVNVQIPLKDILQTFLDFSKQSPEASLVLIKEIIRNLPKESSQFDFNSYLAELLCKVLTDRVDELTPYIVELSRICLDDLAKEQSLTPAVDRLKVLTRMTQGQYIIDILYEDILLRSGDDDVFALGNNVSETVECEMFDDPDQFNIQDMIKSFGLLSNWDNLTLQKKRQVRNVQIPKLWTCVDDFNEKLDKFEALSPPWLSKMRLSLSDTTSLAREHYKWMREVQQWPNNYFQMSAIIECIIWRQMLRETDFLRLPSDIRNEDCMAEWACRFMIRSCYYHNQMKSGYYPVESGELLKQSHSNALVWAERANCMGLSNLVLDCVKANVSDLTSSEMLPWLHQHSRAMMNIGLSNNSVDTLKKTIEKLENTTIDYREDTSPDVLLSIAALSMDLHNNLKSTTQNKATKILEDIIEQKTTLTETKSYSQKCKEQFVNTCQSIMCYYSHIDVKDNNTYLEILSQMNRCLTEIVQTNEHVLKELFIIFIVNKLDGHEGNLAEEFLKEFINNVESSIKYLKGHTVHELRGIKRYIPRSLLKEHPKLCKVIQGVDGDTKYRMCLKLIKDPDYALGKYVEELNDALSKDDSHKWNQIVCSINTNIFRNEYAGTTYRLLHKYANSINSIATFDSSPEFTTKAKEVINTIHKQLSLKSEMKSTLDLQDLCPSLTKTEIHTNEGDSDSLSELLGLEKEKVFRFDRKIQVYTTSIRRACRFRVILTDGSCARFIVKSGECLHLDAGSQAIQGLFNRISGAHVTCYRVSPLSEDSAVIEYMEGHKPLREFIGQSHNLNQIQMSLQRPDDSELIKMSANSTMNSYKSMCQKIPAYCLRNVIEINSASFADFMNKKRNFEQSVAVSSVYHWILGLGDRHLENTLYSLNGGSLSSIDWGTVLQYKGCYVPELPPARLTRNIVAVCDVTVLEAKMQQVLTCLRGNIHLIMTYIKSIFKWINTFVPESIEHKLNYIENILKGSCLPHEITAQAIMDSYSIRHKEQYCKLLEEVFEDVVMKSSYDVEEQISHLLRQCTDPRILAVTRTGLEPWI